MTNYVNFKLSKDVEKNPGPTQYNTDHHEVIIRPFMQNHSSTMQLISPISFESLMQSKLGELCWQSIDVGGAGDCFFRSVSHQLYGNSNHHMHIHTAGVQFMRDNPERFIESNTENSWLRYLNRAVFTWLSKVIEELVWFWFYYALWLASVFTLVLVLRQSSENRSNMCIQSLVPLGPGKFHVVVLVSCKQQRQQSSLRIQVKWGLSRAMFFQAVSL